MRLGDPNSVSVWRSYLVANEYSELQAFRRINLTFQLIFVLFLLKVLHSLDKLSEKPFSLGDQPGKRRQCSTEYQSLSI